MICAACVCVRCASGRGRERWNGRGWSGCDGGGVCCCCYAEEGSSRPSRTRSLDLCCGRSLDLRSVRARVASGFCRVVEGRRGSRCFGASAVGVGSSRLLVVFVGMVLPWLGRSSSLGSTGVAVVVEVGSHKVVVAGPGDMLSMMEAACSHMEDC